MLTLKNRFEKFMLSTKGVESVDLLMKNSIIKRRQRADYLACNRRVVIEQKSLDVNPPLLKFEWVRWWWGASGGRGQGRAKPGAANP
jgi:hypothetical protein